jgi:hypothetical protein
MLPNPKLDSTVRAISARLWPQGYDVATNAPATFKALKAEFAVRGRITVFDGGCESTIYAAPATNHAFRAWHDHGHLHGGYDFSVAGETATARLQIQQLREFMGNDPQADEFSMILEADVIGQSLYYARRKAFVNDQVSFVRAYLQSPAMALATEF